MIPMDDIKLKFGKHKGKSPKEIFHNDEDYGYLMWLYETLDNQILSENLYNKAVILRDYELEGGYDQIDYYPDNY